MDIASITAALNGIKTATEIAKAIKDSDSLIEKAELKLKIVELVDSLADAKLSVIEARELLNHKDQEISNLKKKNEMTFDGRAYWSTNNTGVKEGPFCATCLDVRDKPVRLQKDGRGWYCHTCSVFFPPLDID